jgi:hypothetical protein
VHHDELRDLIAVYVLGALPCDEVPVVERHLRYCVDCCWTALGYSQATVAAVRRGWLRNERRPGNDAQS